MHALQDPLRWFHVPSCSTAWRFHAWYLHACSRHVRAPADEVLAGLGDGVPEIAVEAWPRGEDVVKGLARVGAPEGWQA